MEITKEVLQEIISFTSKLGGQIFYVDRPDYKKSQCCIGWPERREYVDRAMWAIPEGQSNLMVFPAWQCANRGHLNLYHLTPEILICEAHLEQLPKEIYPVEYWNHKISKANEKKEDENWRELGFKIEDGIFIDLMDCDPEEEIDFVRVSDLQGLIDEFNTDC